VQIPVKFSLSFVAVAALLVGLSNTPALAEVFQLHSGGQVRGELLNPDQSPRANYLIKTATGGQIEISAEQVKRVERQSPAEMKYDAVRATYPDTAKGQYELAEWCRENRLPKHRRVHLLRVIELDPDHKDARHGLGYSQIQGRWITQEKLMAENGYLRYKGQWVLPQEIELKEQERKEKLAQTEWAGKLKRWHGWLTSDKAEQAVASIKTIDDPFAAPVLAKYLNGTKHDSREIRLLYVEALGRLQSFAGMDALVAASLFDADEEIRLACLDELVAHKYQPAVGKYVQALRHKENPIVKRAAVCLAHMKDPAAIGPLVDHLVTIHQFEIVKGQPGQTQATFGTGPGSSGGGFTFGGGGTEIVRERFENREVLQALIELTGGVNFDFDIGQWKNWLASQKKPASLDARRD
jgi:hypothetical protein